MSIPIPRQPVPTLEVATLDRGTWRRADQKPKTFTMVVFYRGRHCPICGAYLGDLDRRLEAFKERGPGSSTSAAGAPGDRAGATSRSRPGS